MKLKKQTAAIIISVLMLNAQCFAMTSASYSISTSGVGAANGNLSSSSYSGCGGAGSGAVGTTSSTNYSGISGPYGAVFLATGTTPPVVSDLKIDSMAIIDGDLIKGDGTLTATVTDNIGVDTSKSSVEVDGVFTNFSALTSPSTYEAATGALSYKLNISSSGDHTVKIHAVDTNNNATTVSRSVKTNSGDLAAVAVRFYPNPFNPNSAAGVIAYQLNKDSDVSIYIFNAIGQLIYRSNCSSGTAGGHIGYNEVAWDGKDDFGAIVGNDIYFVRIISAGKVIGKTKIAVIK
ncbi:MAG: hypothetical protein WC527_01015 [Candidatus Margulisiibacteriota bacterium]